MKFYTRRRVSPVITIVSLVDILTMVLMFFVYTTTFKTAQEQVQIKLPQMKSSEKATTQVTPTVLSVKENGDVFLDGKPVAMDALSDAIKKAQADNHPVQMKADEKANFGRVMAVLDTLNIAGIKDVSTLTQPKP